MHRVLVSSFVVALAAVPSWLSRPWQAPAASDVPDPAPVEAPGPVVRVSARTSHPAVLAGEPRDVHLHVALEAADLPRVPRLPMNLALVIDRSGSMGSQDKLVHAKAAAEQLVGRLRPDDRLAVVAYDDRVQTVVPSTPAGERQVFLDAIRALVPGNQTNLHDGLVTGYEEVLSRFDDARLNRVLLLSDGLANVGVTSSSAIGERARRCRERGVRISTMGMGLSYDEDLMRAVSRGAGGNYYYVDEAEAVGRHLDREIDELARIVARDVVVEVELAEGVELRDDYGYAHAIEGRRLVVPISDLFSAERRKVVLRLGVAGAAGERRALARASVRYREAVSREAHAVEVAGLDVRFSDDPDEVRRLRDLGVLVKVEIVQNALALDAAMALQKAGDFAAAQELLAARLLTSSTLNETEYRDPELTRMLESMKQTLLDLERTRTDPRARRDLQLTTELTALGYVE